MATYRLNNMNFSFTVRRAPKSGPTSSDKWNDTMDEISRDLTNIALEWNQKIVPILAGVPDGADDTTINAFINGLDGANLWTDADSSIDAQGGRYFNTVRARPNTVKEQFEAVYTHFSNELITVQTNIIETSGLTDESKAAIGSRIFDSTTVSSSISLDGVSATNQQNIIQVANDLYGDDVALNGDGNAILTNSLKNMVGALLLLHNGAWDDDVFLSHAGSVNVTQDEVLPSTHPGDDAYVGTPGNLRNDLNRIRTEIKILKGTSTWQASHSELYVSGPDALEDLLTSTQGSASKSASNPWGYQYDDIAGLQAILDATTTFTGKNSLTDDSPDYGSPTFISNGDSLETAVSGVDMVLASHSGVIVQNVGHVNTLKLFTGQDDPFDDTPDYASTVFVTPGAPLETAIGELDDALDVAYDEFVSQSGNLDLVEEQLNALGVYAGQATPTEETPLYTSANFIQQGSPLNRAIGALDNALTLVSGLHQNLEVDTMTARWTADNPLGTSVPDVSVAMNGNLVTASGDLHVLDNTRGVVLYSPSGFRFRVTVDDTGSLLTTAF